jgi:dihydropteroate synthase
MLQGGKVWAGVGLERPRIMGILNVTPDSFSDGGRRRGPEAAIEAGLAMAGAGADIVDVGGESTRPGAEPVSPDQEQARVVPVIKALAAAGIRVSVDTRNAATMRAAVAAGACIVNDVSGLEHDPLSAAVVAELDCPVVLMHMRATPATMNAAAIYEDVVAEVRAELLARTTAAIQAGVRPERIALAALGYPVLVGVSRKSFIGAMSGEPDPDRRLGGSLAAGLFAVLRGASILRVHDVRETFQALNLWQALFR